ncbi:MAG TPA: Gfo/Idh/MocA family oxidoreductase [Acidobacteriaceae bacterium]
MLSALRRWILPLLAIIAASAFAHAQAPVRVAIVGLVHGHVAGFLPQLPKHPEVQLVGVSDPDPALRQKYAAEFHLDPKIFFPSEEAMIEATHPQAVLVYTSVAGHRPAIEIAAKHHIAVMVEKPLTISLEDALAIRKIAREEHVPVLVNYETTWYASNKAAHDELESGKLGPLRKLVVHDGHKGPAEIGVQPEFLKWLTDPQQNGAGALYDFGCYGADLATWLMKGEAPLTVTAVAQHLKPEEYPHVDDEGTIILAYPHAQAILQGSWNWPFDRKDMEVYGATGYVKTIKNDKLLERVAGEKEAQEHEAAPLAPPEDGSLDYLEAVLSGKLKPQGDLTALDTNVVVMQILDAARTSAKTGRTVKLTPLPK